MGCARAMTERIVAGGFIVDLMHGLKAPWKPSGRVRIRGYQSPLWFKLPANQLTTESQGIETGRTYAHTFRYVSYGIGHNKANRRTIQIADGQLDATNPACHLPNNRLRAISAPRNR